MVVNSFVPRLNKKFNNKYGLQDINITQLTSEAMQHWQIEKEKEKEKEKEDSDYDTENESKDSNNDNSSNDQHSKNSDKKNNRNRKNKHKNKNNKNKDNKDNNDNNRSLRNVFVKAQKVASSSNLGMNNLGDWWPATSINCDQLLQDITRIEIEYIKALKQQCGVTFDFVFADNFILPKPTKKNGYDSDSSVEYDARSDASIDYSILVSDEDNDDDNNNNNNDNNDDENDAQKEIIHACIDALDNINKINDKLQALYIDGCQAGAFVKY